MDKSITITLMIVLGFMIVAFAGIYYLAPASSDDTISVNGQATLKVAPDLASVYLNVKTEGNTSKESNEKNTKIVNELIQALKNEGFDRDELKTQNFYTNEEYDWSNNKRVSKGYVTWHNFKMTIPSSESEKLGIIVDVAINSGVDIGSVNFEFSPEKENEIKREATKLASEDAMGKAEAIATGLGKKVGRIVSVNEGDFNIYPWVAYEAKAGVVSPDSQEVRSAVADIVPGEREQSARISVVFKIK